MLTKTKKSELDHCWHSSSSCVHVAVWLAFLSQHLLLPPLPFLLSNSRKNINHCSNPRSGVPLLHTQRGCVKPSWGQILQLRTFTSFIFIVTLDDDCTRAWYLPINRLNAVKACTCSLVSEYVSSAALIVILWFKIALDVSNYLHESFMMVAITGGEGMFRNHFEEVVSYKLLNVYDWWIEEEKLATRWNICKHTQQEVRRSYQ